LVTVTAELPAEAIAAAGMAAVNCVALTNVVAGALPPKLTIEAATKFVPLMVSVKPSALPATALFGEIVVIVGVGLDPLGAGSWLLIVEAAPPPHPARNTRLTIPKITSLLIKVVPLFIMTSHIVVPASVHGTGTSRTALTPDLLVVPINCSECQ